MSITTVQGYSPRNDDGTIDDDEIHKYLWVTGYPVQTHQVVSRLGIPRTTVWTAMQRLQQDGRVERVGVRKQGVSAQWRALPPDWQQQPGPEFKHLRANAGLSQTDARDRLEAELGDAPSASQFSKFESPEYSTDLDDDQRRVLWHYYQQQGGLE
jgi:biotin operon repressor